MKICRMKTNRIVNPLGFELGKPFFSWTVEEAEGKKAIWSRVQVSLYSDFNSVIFDSGESAEIDSIEFYPSIQLSPRTRYFWKVTVKSDLGELAESEVAWFETAKMDEAFSGKMISPDLPYDVCPYIRKSFTVPSEIKKARAYFTGLGIYELYVNGVKADDSFLNPGCDAYDKWIQYQSYDVTALLKPGENTIGAIIGNGWAKGRFGFDGEAGCFETNSKGAPSDIFTDSYMLFGELRVETAEGELLVATDESWQSAASPITFSSIYDGERYDSAKEIENWCAPEGDNAQWSTVKLFDGSLLGEMTARLSLPVKVMENFKAELVENPENKIVIDTKQVITGWFEFVCDQPAGTEIRIRYGELLQDGNFYRDNMRSALCEYRYISDGKKRTVRPISTFYGFRYAEITGWQGEFDPSCFTGQAIYSDIETIGNIHTSNEKVNRLFLNSLWSQKDNFVDVPTDCPQRDERMGWTGDAQVFCTTANFNMDTLPFYLKYGKDLYLDQLTADGRVPHVTPLMAKGTNMLSEHGGAVGWADAATVVPWKSYVFSGSKSIIEAQYKSMTDWAEWVFRQDESMGGDRLWHPADMHFGDWLALDGAKSGFDPEAVIGGTDVTFLCSAYYLYSTELCMKAAKALGKSEDEEKYRKRAGEILASIRSEFFTPGGRCAAATQTGNAISLEFGIAPEQFREKVLNQLVDLLKLNDMHLKTGFLGTPVLCRALSDNGANEEAYTLFLQEDLPSWLYEVNMGATTVWERWNSVLPNGKISGISMNSMNHYSYGAIMEWVYRNVCGIEPNEEAAGFRRFTLKPRPDKRLGAAKASYNSPCGLIESEWKYENDKLSYDFTVPFGSTAELDICSDGLSSFTMNGANIIAMDGSIKQRLSAGKYHIE